MRAVGAIAIVLICLSENADRYLQHIIDTRRLAGLPDLPETPPE